MTRELARELVSLLTTSPRCGHEAPGAVILRPSPGEGTRLRRGQGARRARLSLLPVLVVRPSRHDVRRFYGASSPSSSSGMTSTTRRNWRLPPRSGLLHDTNEAAVCQKARPGSRRERRRDGVDGAPGEDGQPPPHPLADPRAVHGPDKSRLEYPVTGNTCTTVEPRMYISVSSVHGHAREDLDSPLEARLPRKGLPVAMI